MNKVTVDNLKKLYEEHMNSCAISVYFYVTALSMQKTYKSNTKKSVDGSAFLPHISPYRLSCIMNENGIGISHVQVAASLKELEEHRFITFSDDILMLLDVVPNEGKTYKPYIPLSKFFLSKEFYTLSVKGQRLLLYICSHYIKSKEFTFNLLGNKNTKASMYKKLCAILRVNRHQKIRDSIEELMPYLQISCFNQYKNQEVYQFRLSALLAESLKSASELINTHFNQKIWSRIIKYFDSANHSWTVDEVKEVLYAVFPFRLNALKHILNLYILKCQSSDRNIRNATQYIKGISMNQIIPSLKTI